jgi:hypothetical protein
MRKKRSQLLSPRTRDTAEVSDHNRSQFSNCSHKTQEAIGNNRKTRVHEKDRESMGGDSLHCCYREQVGYALYARFKLPKLYKYALSGDWDLIPARCRSHPKEASFVNKYAPNDTALHRLLQCDCTTTANSQDETTLHCMEEWKHEAVVAFLEANQQAAALPDAFGRTPLHLACSDVSSCSSFLNRSNDEEENAIALLIAQANPHAASVQDKIDQRTPLHYLVARNDEIPIGLLCKLLEYCPLALCFQDITGETPTDIVERRCDEIGNADAVLQILRDVQQLQPLEAVRRVQSTGSRRMAPSRRRSLTF